MVDINLPAIDEARDVWGAQMNSAITQLASALGTTLTNPRMQGTTLLVDTPDGDTITLPMPKGDPGPVGADSAQRLLAALHAGVVDQSMLYVSDSTGNEPSEWIYQTTVSLAARYPAWTVLYRLWNDTDNSWGAPQTIQTGTGARTLTVYNLAVAGATTRYFQGAKFPAALGGISPTWTAMSLGHNEGTVPGLWLGQYAGFVEEVAEALPETDICLIAQNPASDNTFQQQRREVYREHAARRGYGFVDVCAAFLDDGRPLSALLIDTLHPNAAGTAIWVATVLDALIAQPDLAPRPQGPSSLAAGGEQILVNGDFADFAGALPAGWAANASGAVTAAKSTEFFESANGYAVRLTSTAAGGNLVQNLPVNRCRGRWITLVARTRVAAGQANTAGRIALVDPAGNSTSQAEAFARDGYRYVVVTRKIPADATYVRALLYGDSAGGGGWADYDAVWASTGRLPRRAGTGARGLQGPAGVVAGQIDFLSTIGAMGPFLYASTLSTGVAIANDALLVELRPHRNVTVDQLSWMAGANSSGSYDIGLYTAAGVRLWSRGSTPWPAANSRTVETVSPPVELVAGTAYYVAFASDATTGLLRGIPEAFTDTVRTVTKSYLSLRVASSFPLPASITPGASRGGRYPAISLHGT